MFRIDLGEVELSVDEIWPDGNAPESPTAEDVAKEMRNYGRVPDVVHDWCLMGDLTVYGPSGDRAVVR